MSLDGNGISASWEGGQGRAGKATRGVKRGDDRTGYILA